jgi:succinate dehydrogenase/fumarate reductase flavoprotein subunit
MDIQQMKNKQKRNTKLNDLTDIQKKERIKEQKRRYYHKLKTTHTYKTKNYEKIHKRNLKACFKEMTMVKLKKTNDETHKDVILNDISNIINLLNSIIIKLQQLCLIL